MLQCKSCYILSSLCLTHYLVAAGAYDGPSIDVNIEPLIQLQPKCKMISPATKSKELKAAGADIYVFDKLTNFDLRQWDEATFTPLDANGLNFNSSLEMRNIMLSNDSVSRLSLIYLSEQRRRENGWDHRILVDEFLIPLSKKRGFYLITQQRIISVRDCKNGASGISSLTSNDVGDLMLTCGFTYDQCLCNEEGEVKTEDGIGNDCLSIDTCHADTALLNGYHCEECPFGYMGEHCQKSIFFIGTFAIFIISLTSLVGAVLAPMRSWRYYPDLQAGMVALAIGCLSGDAVLHLIPIIFGLHGHDEHGSHEHHEDHDDHEEHEEDSPVLSHEMVSHRGMMLLLGLYLFNLFETAIALWHNFKQGQQMQLWNDEEKTVGPRRSKQSSKSRHASETCMSAPGHKLSIIEANQDNLTTCYDAECNENNDDVFIAQKEMMVVENPQEKLIPKEEKFPNGVGHIPSHGHTHGHSHGHSHGDFALVGWMVILGDAFHNFADGLAIGAAFSASYSIGLGTVFAVFFHELPHEIGDFAVLLSSGFSVKKAMFWNLVSSLTCFIGFFLGTILANSEEIQIWILAISAGAFVYIALVDMLPEIRLTSLSPGQSLIRRFIVQQIGLITGALFMWLLAVYEEDLVNLFS